MSDKPFSLAAEQNREAILAVLKQEFEQVETVLEIGSGTGQHAVYFAQNMPHLRWLPSDKAASLPGIRVWIQETGIDNVREPLELDVCGQWPDKEFDAVFAANVAHIMHWHEIEAMFSGTGAILRENGIFCLYGPFKIGGQYTSESNRKFDQWLRTRDPDSCIRDKHDLNRLAKFNTLQLQNDWAMPANNQILSWRKI